MSLPAGVARLGAGYCVYVPAEDTEYVVCFSRREREPNPVTTTPPVLAIEIPPEFRRGMWLLCPLNRPINRGDIGHDDKATARDILDPNMPGSLVVALQKYLPWDHTVGRADTAGDALVVYRLNPPKYEYLREWVKNRTLDWPLYINDVVKPTYVSTVPEKGLTVTSIWDILMRYPSAKFGTRYDWLVNPPKDRLIE